jgi:CMP-N,N'-diacetyllegionaminic acid synthase
MIDNKKVLAIIPARGGSKRLPRKNVLTLSGKPLIAWTIEAAKKSKYIDEVIISTDDEEISNISQRYGGKVPELRPLELSTDTATTKSVLIYTLNKFRGDADIVVVLQPTSPLRNSRHIDDAMELLLNKNAFSVVSVTECEHSPLWTNTLPDNGSMKDFIKVSNEIRSQDLQTYFRLNGAIYIYNIDMLLESKSLAYTEKTYAYKMPAENSIDIDNFFDFKIACFLVGEQ